MIPLLCIKSYSGGGGFLKIKHYKYPMTACYCRYQSCKYNEQLACRAQLIKTFDVFEKTIFYSGWFLLPAGSPIRKTGPPPFRRIEVKNANMVSLIICSSVDIRNKQKGLSPIADLMPGEGG